jgi:hypothetical protein
MAMIFVELAFSGAVAPNLAVLIEFELFQPEALLSALLRLQPIYANLFKNHYQ